MGSMALEREMSTPPTPQLKYGTYTLPIVPCKSIITITKLLLPLLLQYYDNGCNNY